MTLSCLLFVNLNFGCVSVEGSFVFVRFMYPIFVQAFHIYEILSWWWCPLQSKLSAMFWFHPALWLLVTSLILQNVDEYVLVMRAPGCCCDYACDDVFVHVSFTALICESAKTSASYLSGFFFFHFCNGFRFVFKSRPYSTCWVFLISTLLGVEGLNTFVSK